MATSRILLVEDDRELRDVIARALAEEDIEVASAGTGGEAMRLAGDEPPDALVIDIGLPDTDGRDLCQALRAQGVRSPVLFLTARDALTDRLAGFAAGGDDYLTKPFSLAELIARLRVMLRRAGVDGKLTVAGLSLDPTTHRATCGGDVIELTPTEFRLLAALAGQPGVAVRRRDLIRAAWPDGAIVHDNTLDVYLARLRRKLRGLAEAPTIATVQGVGYRVP